MPVKAFLTLAAAAAVAIGFALPRPDAEARVEPVSQFQTLELGS